MSPSKKLRGAGSWTLENKKCFRDNIRLRHGTQVVMTLYTKGCIGVPGKQARGHRVVKGNRNGGGRSVL